MQEKTKQMESQWTRLQAENEQLKKDTIAANEKYHLINEIEDLEAAVRFLPLHLV